MSPEPMEERMEAVVVEEQDIQQENDSRRDNSNDG
jgi:hypothetical protein